MLRRRKKEKEAGEDERCLISEQELGRRSWQWRGLDKS